MNAVDEEEREKMFHCAPEGCPVDRPLFWHMSQNKPKIRRLTQFWSLNPILAIFFHFVQRPVCDDVLKIRGFYRGFGHFIKMHDELPRRAKRADENRPAQSLRGLPG